MTDDWPGNQSDSKDARQRGASERNSKDEGQPGKVLGRAVGGRVVKRVEPRRCSQASRRSVTGSVSMRPTNDLSHIFAWQGFRQQQG